MGRVRFRAAAGVAAFTIAVASLCGTASRAAAGLADCPGDCNGDGVVVINELIIAVNIALDLQTVSACGASDLNHDGRITVDELIRNVDAAIIGCSAVATPTNTATTTESPAATATGTATQAATASEIATATSTLTPPATATATDTAIATPTGTTDATVTGTSQPSATATPADTESETPELTPTETPEETATEPAGTPTVTATPIANPTGLSATIDGEAVLLAWTPPNPLSGYTFALVLRRLNAPVEGPADPEATMIYFGDASVAADAVANLLPDVTDTSRTYHYAVYGCSGPGQCEPTGSATTLTPTLVQALRAGGYTLHWRHSSATVCEDQLCLGSADAPLIPDWWKRCDAACPPDVGEPAPGMCPNHTGTATARQLNADGVAEATAIGQAFDALAIPVGRVMSSEYCRNFTTALLMDFGPPIELVSGISYFVYDEPNRCDHAYELIDEMPAGGTNTAIIGHAGFTGSCPFLGLLAWSEVAIFKPDGQGGETFITRVTWDKWPALVVPGPTGLEAAIEDSAVHLTWTAPDPSSGFTSVRLLRRLNGTVAGPNDPAATVVFGGSATSFDDDAGALLPDTPGTPRTYHYAVYGCAGSRCETTGSSATVTQSLVALLRAGGYTIFWRHADADVCADNTALGTAATTTSPDWWKSCDANCATATARQLSDAGRAHAMAIGSVFEDRDIPVGRVISSEYCRNVTTAELFDFGPTAELDPGITFFVYDEANRCQHSYDRIGEVPAPGTNTAIIGHSGFSPSCLVLGGLAWSEAAIFKPDGLGNATLVARVTWDQWPAL